MAVRHKNDGTATFDATVDTIFKYMSDGDHGHIGFKSRKLVGVSDNQVMLVAEVQNPDGSTFKKTINGI